MKERPMHVFHYLRQEITRIIGDLQRGGTLPSGLNLSRMTVEPPKDATHGDVATNAGMVLAKECAVAPTHLAALIGDRLKDNPFVDHTAVAGPGFLNIRLSSAFWLNQLAGILKAGADYGTSTLGDGVGVNVEYPSVNPTGPVHIGHCRIAIVGDVMASLLEKAGYRVTRECYINDAGGQANALARSLYCRYIQALGINGPEPDAYRGDYLRPPAAEMANLHGHRFVDQGESVWLDTFRTFAVNAMMDVIKADLAALGLKLDVYTSEKALTLQGHVDQAVVRLEGLGLVYRGILDAPKGAAIDDWEPREQLLFKSSAFGDDCDRPLQKSDGSWTYFTPDVAYHYDKFRRGSTILVDILGADHVGYVKRITAATKAITEGKAQVVARICQLVKFTDGQNVLKMSKRLGTFVGVREALDKVGRDAMRFMMVSRKNDAPLDFDFKRVVEQSKDNPVFYVQYAYARCHSILRHGAEQFPGQDLTQDVDLTTPMAEADFALIKALASWPRLVEIAAESYEPHRVAYYLEDIAARFHALWNLGKEDTHLRFIVPGDITATRRRLALVRAVVIVLKSGFDIIGITPREEMR